MSKIVCVTGAGGFIGSNLSMRLIREGYFVIGVDDFSSSHLASTHIKELLKTNKFSIIHASVYDINLSTKVHCEIRKLMLTHDKKLSGIFNFACPASPPAYQKLPLHTFLTCTNGLENVLELAVEHGCKIVHASTSEIYGDPLEHPQHESYRGNTNTWGPRSCYDEGKRAGETLCYIFREQFKVDARVLRIFNTYGPHMDCNDGRVVTNFLKAALSDQDITIYGDGLQTRSLCYVDDLVEGVMRLFNANEWSHGPVNIGNPTEYTVSAIAEIITELTGSKSKIVYKDLPVDDPKKRKPDITLAESMLNWTPDVSFTQGVKKLIEYWKLDPSEIH